MLKEIERIKKIYRFLFTYNKLKIILFQGINVGFDEVGQLYNDYFENILEKLAELTEGIKIVRIYKSCVENSRGIW